MDGSEVLGSSLKAVSGAPLEVLFLYNLFNRKEANINANIPLVLFFLSKRVSSFVILILLKDATIWEKNK